MEEEPASAEDEQGAGDGRATRRDALKKAAAAGVVGAAVWAAPRIEGLSVVPDYAAAGTASVPQITFRLNGNGPGALGGNNWMNAAPSPAYTITQNGPSDNQAIILTAPLGVVGNAVYTFPSGQNTDGSNVSSSVTFHVDPPFNRCIVTGGTADWDGSTSDRGQTSVSTSGNLNPNANSPITVNVNTGPGSPSNGNNFWNPVVKLNWLEVRIQCQ